MEFGVVWDCILLSEQTNQLLHCTVNGCTSRGQVLRENGIRGLGPPARIETSLLETPVLLRCTCVLDAYLQIFVTATLIQ